MPVTANTALFGALDYATFLGGSLAKLPQHIGELKVAHAIIRLVIFFKPRDKPGRFGKTAPFFRFLGEPPHDPFLTARFQVSQNGLNDRYSQVEGVASCVTPIT